MKLTELKERKNLKRLELLKRLLGLKWKKESKPNVLKEKGEQKNTGKSKSVLDLNLRPELRLREENVKLKLKPIVLNKKEELRNTGKNKKLDVSKLRSSLNLKNWKEKRELKKLVKRA